MNMLATHWARENATTSQEVNHLTWVAGSQAHTCATCHAQVRLYLPFYNSNFDLYVEQYKSPTGWTVVYSAASLTSNNEQVTFQTTPGGYYRFRYGYAMYSFLLLASHAN